MTTKTMMKKFKDMWMKTKPVKVLAYPVHGHHAQEDPKQLKEAVEKKHVHKWADQKKDHEEETHRDLSNHYKKHADQHSNQHIMSYTKASRIINNDLINKEAVAGYKLQKRTEEHVKGIDSYLNAAPALHKDVDVYHGLANWHPGMQSHMHPDRHIHMPAYTSTSLSREEAFNWSGNSGQPTTRNARHILHIKLKKGQKPGAYLNDVTLNPEEKEFLIKRNAKLKVERKPTVLMGKKNKSVDNHNPHIYVWHAHYLEDSDEPK